MNKKQRLIHLTDILHVRRNGKVFTNTYMVLLVAQNYLDYSRFAVSAGRRVGNAVDRNRVKRRLRACVDEIYSMIALGWDLIFYARQPVLSSDFAAIRDAMKALIREAGLMD